MPFGKEAVYKTPAHSQGRFILDVEMCVRNETLERAREGHWIPCSWGTWGSVCPVTTAGSAQPEAEPLWLLPARLSHGFWDTTVFSMNEQTYIQA